MAVFKMGTKRPSRESREVQQTARLSCPDHYLPRKGPKTTLRVERIFCPVDFSECSTEASDCTYSTDGHYAAKLIVKSVPGALISLHGGGKSETQVDEMYSHQTAAAHEELCELPSNARNGLEREFVPQHGPSADFIAPFYSCPTCGGFVTVANRKTNHWSRIFVTTLKALPSDLTSRHVNASVEG
jgi:hypothetical protein